MGVGESRAAPRRRRRRVRRGGGGGAPPGEPATAQDASRRAGAQLVKAKARGSPLELAQHAHRLVLADAQHACHILHGLLAPLG